MKQIGFLVMTVISCNSQEVKFDEQQLYPQLEYFKSKVPIPNGFTQSRVTLVEVDQKNAYLFRYEKPINNGLLQEHFSFIVTVDKPYRILGFSCMDVKYADKELLSEARVREIATAFLLNMDADLARNLENLWIESHGESVIIDGKEQRIVGMKYKCYRKSHNDYAWVIVGHDASVITFERDIIWNNAMSVRVTNAWLHDQWVLNNAKEL
ncbi:hypothetical protein [Flavobacterium sp. NKUCC04_CG]|uniref:hypothetical protein n=1 Tax=Flavobacterium sp. NKUCC04_CG TaxID=2842121 RepID=UPI001C5BEFFB|nr:hypothetical protein [Flavobacterium sp. NKUCC04_CG]MBW3518990.1 hypothetical protein [Flavobacterium sp. NKUCC04_CG]